MSEQSKKPRVSQEERRTEVIDAALVEFGRYGYAGTSTSMIAARAGIRQPYIYALFENKRDLFLACHDVLNDRIRDCFKEIAESEDSPQERLHKMGIAYLGLITDDDRVRCHLHVFAAAGIDDLKQPIREGFERLFDDLLEISGASKPEVARFFATGIMVNVMVALDEPFEMIEHLELPTGDET